MLFRGGRPVMGTADVIASVPVPQIAAYHDSRYVGSNLVVAAAGNLEHDRIVELVRAAVDAPDGSADGAGDAPHSADPRIAFHSKRTEQYHLCLGGIEIGRA